MPVSEHKRVSEANKLTLLLDVDGVVNAMPRRRRARGYTRYMIDAYRIHIHRDTHDMIDQLRDHFNIAWFTMWNDLAAPLIGPHVGLEDAPFVETSWERGWDAMHSLGYSQRQINKVFYAKTPLLVDALDQEQRWVWIDDAHSRWDREYLERRGFDARKFRLVEADASVGITWRNVEEAVEFARATNLDVSASVRSPFSVAEESPLPVAEEESDISHHPGSAPGRASAVTSEASTSSGPRSGPGSVPGRTSAVVPGETSAVVLGETSAVVSEKSSTVAPGEGPEGAAGRVSAMVPEDGSAAVPGKKDPVQTTETGGETGTETGGGIGAGAETSCASASENSRAIDVDTGSNSDAPRLCSQCGAEMKPVVYGSPSPELFEAADRGEVVLGGCCPTFPGEQMLGCPACGLGPMRDPVPADSTN